MKETIGFIASALVVVILLCLCSWHFVTSVSTGLEKFKVEYNQCRDKGGTVSYCAVGLK